MAVKQLWVSPPQFVDANGDPYSGAYLFFYAAGSSTKQATYTDSTGGTPCDNPITLNASGYPAVSGTVVAPWGTVGQTYKIGLAAPGSADPPASFVWTQDNVAPINDTASTVDEWISGPTPTYVSATSLTLVGDQTTTFHVGRRLKTTNSGGTIYSTITVSAYTSLTTLTVVNDSGTLDAGLSAVSYGIVSSANTSIPGVETSAGAWIHQTAVTHEAAVTNQATVTNQGAVNDAAEVTVASAATMAIGAAASKNIYVSGSTGPITAFDTIAAGAVRRLRFASTPTLTHNGTSLILPTSANITVAAGDTAEFESLGSGNWVCRWYYRATGQSLVQFNSLNANTYNIADSPATWTKPSTGQAVLIECWGGGGGGGGSTGGNRGSGGGGGGYGQLMVPLSILGSTETVTIGAGGTAAAFSTTDTGGTGGTTTFGSRLSVGGGGGGQANAAGGGAGGAQWASAQFANTLDGGAGGSGTTDAGGNSVWGGGGGGGGLSGAGGTSTYGGAGGTGGGTRTGSVPGGGGAGSNDALTSNAGAGGAGRCRVTVF